jgi:hypothetical protein
VTRHQLVSADRHRPRSCKVRRESGRSPQTASPSQRRQTTDVQVSGGARDEPAGRRSADLHVSASSPRTELHLPSAGPYQASHSWLSLVETVFGDTVRPPGGRGRPRDRHAHRTGSSSTAGRPPADDTAGWFRAGQPRRPAPRRHARIPAWLRPEHRAVRMGCRERAPAQPRSDRGRAQRAGPAPPPTAGRGGRTPAALARARLALPLMITPSLRDHARSWYPVGGEVSRLLQPIVSVATGRPRIADCSVAPRITAAPPLLFLSTPVARAKTANPGACHDPEKAVLPRTRPRERPRRPRRS